MRQVFRTFLYRYIAGVVVLATGLFTTAAKANDNNIRATQEGLHLSKSAVWSSPRIRVCWEANSGISDVDKENVKNHIRSVFEYDLPFHFIGWDTCTQNRYSQDIRIGRTEGAPRVVGFGKENAGQPNNLWFNTTFFTWSTDCRSNEFNRQYCVRVIAAHEFGHKLAIRHEQERMDTPADCSSYLQDPCNYQYVPPYSGSDYIYLPYSAQWDLHSIMNYCNNEGFSVNGNNYAQTYDLHWNNRGVLSGNDSAGFKGWYGSGKIITAVPSSMGLAGQGTTFVLFNPQARTQPYAQPDLYSIVWGGTTGSGRTEIHATSASTNYQDYTVHAATGLDTFLDTNRRWGHTLGDFDRDGKPDMYFFDANLGTQKMQVHVMSGSSNWQNYSLHAQTPLAADSNWKFTLGDFDNDGIADIFAIRARDARTAYIAILSGASNYSDQNLLNVFVFDNVGFFDAPKNVKNCRFFTGNFFNNLGASFVDDVVCALMDNNSTSTSTQFLALTSSSNYGVINNVGYSQMRNEAGDLADFSV